MKDDDTIGYRQPLRSTLWQPGRSGNPQGRPKSRSEIVADAATILSEPVTARNSDGSEVRLDAIEASNVSLCKKGLKDHKPSLLEAIRYMFDFGLAAEKTKKEDKERQQLFQKVGTKLRFLPINDADD